MQNFLKLHGITHLLAGFRHFSRRLSKNFPPISNVLSSLLYKLLIFDDSGKFLLHPYLFYGIFRHHHAPVQARNFPAFPAPLCLSWFKLHRFCAFLLNSVHMSQRKFQQLEKILHFRALLSKEKQNARELSATSLESELLSGLLPTMAWLQVCSHEPIFNIWPNFAATIARCTYRNNVECSKGL